MTILVLIAVLFLAATNGANDNFKGVATIYGSGTASYRASLLWATLTTLAGSLCAVLFASALTKAFSGSGLVPGAVAQTMFAAAVVLGAALTVLLATRMGMPVSTTHALTGALVGAGVLAAGSLMNLRVLGAKFVVPLLFSPLASLLLTRSIEPVASALRHRLGITGETCACVGAMPGGGFGAPSSDGVGAIRVDLPVLSANVGEAPVCAARYEGVMGISAQRVVDGAHFLSAGAMSFARGLNDAPKIAGVLLVTRAVGGATASMAIGVAMALGGVLGARRVAETVSKKITAIEPGQGLVANSVTAALVMLATPLGLPVSTTHVSTGSIVGIGLASGKAQWRTIGEIALAWITTLPIAALIAAVLYAALR
ncbi:MAG: inorganic phosphate transporter [Myxococcales bacterium]|nr:inorganic phosphate transporter [Myxococcales bacterium]